MNIITNDKEFIIKSEYEFEVNKNSHLLTVNNDVVGFANVNIAKNQLYIYEIEILENHKNKGYGKAFINELFNEFPHIDEIKGYSMEESKPFFTKIGADFLEPTCLNCENCTYLDNKSNCDDYFDAYFLIQKVI